MYNCKFCPCKFKSRQALGGHMNAHRDLRKDLYRRSSSSYAGSVQRASHHAPPFMAWRIQYYHPFARSVPAPFAWQSGTKSLAPVLAMEGYRIRVTSDEGHHFGGLHEVNPEETVDGIDLTLKL
jgi:hypothetical protein